MIWPGSLDASYMFPDLIYPGGQVYICPPGGWQCWQLCSAHALLWHQVGFDVGLSNVLLRMNTAVIVNALALCSPAVFPSCAC